ncbi:MAG: hypothetical protein RL559_1414 [Pseudomonadota bacterium]|jgi:general secretion pathway protein M
MNAWNTLRVTARTAWQQRSARERHLLAWGATVLLLALVWTQLIAPAWRVWREAPLRQATLEAQTRQMRQWQAEAQQLQTPRRIERSEALRLLSESATALLGPGAQLTAQGEGLRLSLQAAPAAGLAQWLAQAREQALALPSQAQLERQDKADAEPTWRGTVLLRLP